MSKNALLLPSDVELEKLADNLDLSDLAVYTTDELYAQARACREIAEHHYQQARQHWLELGRLLLEIKSRVKHGEFMATVPSEVGVSYKRAQQAMYVATNWKGTSTLPDGVGLDKLVEAVHEQKAIAKASMPKVLPPVPSVTLPSSCSIEVADALDLPLPDAMIDLIVTSPPYGLGIDYADTDDDQGYETYRQHVFAWAVEMHRVAGANGRLCLNVPLDVTYGGVKALYADWLLALRDAGWKYRFSIIWNEDNISKTTARGSVDSPSAPHVIARVETILVMHKGEWNLHRADEHNLSHEEWLAYTDGVWSFPGTTSPAHPAPFPEELPRRCMKLFSFKGDSVLDPFVGSGTSGVVAAQLGRTFWGFDHSPIYVEYARARLHDALAKLV